MSTAMFDGTIESVLTISETLQTQSDAAVTKTSAFQYPLRFLVFGLLAGAYIGVGVVLMVSAAGPLVAAGDGLAKLVSGLVFSAALTIVVFAGAELVTSAMMILPLGALMRRISIGRAAGTMTFMFVANFFGAFLFAVIVVLSGVLTSNPGAGDMLNAMLLSKAQATPLELFMRGVLCNVLVCLAIWMGSRVKSDGTKIALIFIAITTFVTSGFEHVVANMTTYWIGVLTSNANTTAALFAGNMVWVGLGNLIGGAVVVGLAYWFVGGSPKLGVDSLRAAENATSQIAGKAD